MKLLRRLVPRTLLARIFLLIALLLLIAQAYWTVLFRFNEHGPRAHNLAERVVSMVNLTRAALLASAPARRAALLDELSEREGILIVPAEGAEEEPMDGHNPFHADVAREVVAVLGPHTRFAREVNDRRAFWVSFSISNANDPADEYWLGLFRERPERRFPWQWIGWTTLAALLSLLVAGYIVSRINRPLRAMADACAAIGRGERLPMLREEGPTEIAALAQALNSMTSDLARLEAERAEVLAGISHDLRTPLARLRLAAELSGDEALRDDMAVDIDQIDNLLGQFLDYARGDSGEHAAVVDLAALLGEVAARRDDVCLQLPQAPEPPLPPCLLRPRALLRAVGNLLDNARKYAGGELTLSAALRDGHLHINVIDHGPGIAAEEIERLRRPFTRSDNARGGPPGTGLGLAIVDRIARLHNGELQLLPTPGGGLTARLDLPWRAA